MVRRATPRFGAILFLAGFVLLSATSVSLRAESLPARLSDPEFWALISNLSEPNGVFRSENLLSNEVRLQSVIPSLTRIARTGRVYVGVGPEQNFTYIAALKPAMAFIIDIRRGNLDLHLMYKALFELSADRREFVSRLFSRVLPPGLAPDATANEIFESAANAETNEAFYHANLAAITDRLVTRHAFALSEEDLANIEEIYKAFFQFGPELRYSTSGGAGGRLQPSYAELMKASDYSGQSHAFLASEETFAAIKELEARNMVVPVVGNFAGPTAIRAVSAYLKQRDAIVSAFYLSNVEQYLRQDRLWEAFCGNAATLPVDETSTFIRAVMGRGAGSGFVSELGRMAVELENCHYR